MFNEAPKFIRQQLQSDTCSAASSRASSSAWTRSSAPRPTTPRAITAGRPVSQNFVPTAQRARRLVYAPDLDGRADPGEIVWTWVVYEDDPTKGKDRPVLVVGRDQLHPARPDAVQPGPPPRRPELGGHRQRRAGTTRAGRAGCGWTGCSTCPKRASAARARSWSARRSRSSPTRAARRILLELARYRGSRHIGHMVGPSSGSLISPMISNPNRK